MKNSFIKQLVPIFLTILTCTTLIGVLFLFINLLNLLPIHNKISLSIQLADILVGLAIYLKTSIDFALFIGNLMRSYPGTNNRIAIELGTALGNGLGTLAVLTIWTLFKEVPFLMICMIAFASLVLFRMAEDSLHDFFETRHALSSTILLLLNFFYNLLGKINIFFNPLVSRLLPRSATHKKRLTTFAGLLFFSFSIPFVLGLDDFAGYIPLFSIVNVFGFATGTFLGHMLLTVSLFATPTVTVKIVRLPIIIAFGGIVFMVLAGVGLFEAGKIVLALFFP